VINLGGSVAAWPRGSYSQFMQAACPRIEVVNIAKAKIGARQLKARFALQVLKNRRIRKAPREETWLVFQGGLNSLSTPHLTNKYLRDIFRMGHKAGIRTVGLTLAPWGNEHRWRAARGLEAFRRTKLAVDFIMKRLTPAEALGKSAHGRAEPTWQEGELPEISVDIYDSGLRDKEAAPLDSKRLRHRLRYDAGIARTLRKLQPQEREAALDQLEKEARALSKQFMKSRFRAFDSIHPNLEGHRLIAKKICSKASPSWGCSCAAIDTMQWVVKERGLFPRVQ
jgi:hypothetical protein